MDDQVPRSVLMEQPRDPFRKDRLQVTDGQRPGRIDRYLAIADQVAIDRMGPQRPLRVDVDQGVAVRPGLIELPRLGRTAVGTD